MRRLVAQLVSHPVTAVGVVLAVASGCVFAGFVAFHPFDSSGNSYADIVVFVMLPALSAVGLLLMPIGLWFQRGRPEIRRGLFIVTAATLIGLVALSFGSQRAPHLIAQSTTL